MSCVNSCWQYRPKFCDWPSQSFWNWSVLLDHWTRLESEVAVKETSNYQYIVFKLFFNQPLKVFDWHSAELNFGTMVTCRLTEKAALSLSGRIWISDSVKSGILYVCLTAHNQRAAVTQSPVGPALNLRWAIHWPSTDCQMQIKHKTDKNCEWSS